MSADPFTIAPPTRFEAARAGAAHQATMLLAVQILVDASGRVARAGGLLAAAATPGALGVQSNRQEASRAIRSAIDELREVIEELGE